MKKYKYWILIIIVNLLCIDRVIAKETTCNYYTDNEEYKIICDIINENDITCRIYRNKTLAKNDAFKPKNWEATVRGNQYQCHHGDSEGLYKAGFRWSGKQLYIDTQYQCPKYAALEYVESEGAIDFTHDFNMLVTNYNGDFRNYYNAQWLEDQQWKTEQGERGFKVLYFGYRKEEDRYKACENSLSEYMDEINTKIEEFNSSRAIETLKEIEDIISSADAKVCGCGLEADNQKVKDYLKVRSDFAELGEDHGIHLQTMHEVCPRFGQTSEELEENTKKPTNGGDKKVGFKFANEYIQCGEARLPYGIAFIVQNVVKVIKIAIPILLIVMGMIDFLMAVVGNDEKQMKEKQNKFIKRIIAGVIIFFVVAIIQFVFGYIVSGDKGKDALSCVSCFIGSEEDCKFVDK